MINERYLKYVLKKYCSEDISLIENYYEAINSDEVWDCHHRLEIELNKTPKELQKLNLYYNRPAKELIFLTHSEHSRLHRIGNQYTKGRHLTDEHKRILSKIHKGEKRGPVSEVTKQKMRKPHKSYKKYKWLTPTGEIIEMCLISVKRFHPDWTFLE